MFVRQVDTIATRWCTMFLCLKTTRQPIYYACEHEYVCTCVCMCVHVCTCECVHVFVHVCARVHVHIYMCAFGCVCMCGSACGLRLSTSI